MPTLARLRAINLVAYHIGLGVSEAPPSSLAVGRVGHIQDGIDAIKPTVITFDQSQQQAIGSNWWNSMRGGMPNVSRVTRRASRNA